MCVLHILTMIVLIKFDLEQYKIYIPDGYILNLENIRSDFFEWIYYQPEYMIYDKSNAILTYGVDDFLKFLNETIFTGCSNLHLQCLGQAYVNDRQYGTCG